ncbi:unnamed protein product [Colias eurytheme]|nr:unnamed protein product [Colias eurytheme]
MDIKQEHNRELTCVLFPGIVKNEEKAVQCLGGIKTISQICAQPSKKQLTLSFHPDNPFMKPANADAKPTAGVLLKVKVKKTRDKGNTIKTEVVNTSVLGHVKKIYKFDTICDFQFLPLKNTNTGKPECALEDIIPSGLDDLKFMEQPAPLYIVPGNFIRFDKPINYYYTDKRSYVAKNDDLPDDKDEVHKMRSERGVPIPKYQFNLTDELPTEPHEYFVDIKNSKIIGNQQLEQEFEMVKKMFEERPIWSYNHIKHHTKIKLASLKIILPCLGLHNRTGPWKMSWVKFGYDPRKEPQARYYQTLDFRVRHAVTYDQVTSRRERSFKKVPLDESSTEEHIPEGSVYFKPFTIPPQRQIYYMYCDIQVPEVQEILSVEPPTGYLCHAKRGWLAPDAAQKCRDIIFKYIKQAVLENKSAELKLEQGSSGDEMDTDDEEASGTADTSVAEID